MNKTTNKILSINIDLFELELPDLNDAQIRAVKDKADKILTAIKEYEKSKNMIKEITNRG